MSEAPERIWAFPIKDWFRGGCSTHKIIERKYARDVEYIRADIHDARIKELKEELEDQTSIFHAWFGTRKLAHDAVDGAVLDAAKGYLRTSRAGGMCPQESDMIAAVIEDMARLSVFADLFARTKMPLPSAPKQRKENKT
jgi:hypothetical protein